MSSAVETSLIIRSKEIARDSSTALRYARNERIEKAFDKAKSLMDKQHLFALTFFHARTGTEAVRSSLPQLTHAPFTPRKIAFQIQ